FGLNPRWHHFMGLLFHVINSNLVFIVFRRLTGATWKPAIVAGLFALHPLHVESVAWVAERKDVLSTFFFLLTIWAYAKYAEPRVGTEGARGGKEESRVEGRGSSVRGSSVVKKESSKSAQSVEGKRGRRTVGFYLLALGFFALGLMSKPM